MLQRKAICLQDAKHRQAELWLKEWNPILGYFNADFLLDNQSPTHVEEPEKPNVSGVEKS